MASQHHPPGETTVKVIELPCERPTLTVRTPDGNEGVLPVLTTVMLTDPPTVTVDRPASPILQAGTAKVIFEVQRTGELRVTGNAWTDAQVFNPGEAIEFRMGRQDPTVAVLERLAHALDAGIIEFLLPALVAELVNLRVAVLFAAGTDHASAGRRTRPTTISCFLLSFTMCWRISSTVVALILQPLFQALAI